MLRQTKHSLFLSLIPSAVNSASLVTLCFFLFNNGTLVIMLTNHFQDTLFCAKAEFISLGAQ